MIKQLKEALRKESEKLEELYIKHGWKADHPDVEAQHQVVHDLLALINRLEDES